MNVGADALLSTLADLVAERVAKRLSLDARDSKPVKPLPDFYGEVDIAKRSGISRRTLQSWRLRNAGPPTVRAGRKVLYPRVDFEQWIQGRKKGTDRSRLD